MERFGREALCLWKQFAPRAFDALREPSAYFEHIDAHYAAYVEQLAREDTCRHDNQSPPSFWIEQRSQTLLEAMPFPPREPTFLDDLDEAEMLDPQGRFLRGGLPHRPHRLWVLLEDPTVPAEVFQQELRAWYTTLPRAPWIEHAGPPTPPFHPDGPGAVVREAAGIRPEIQLWPSASVLTFATASGAEAAFQVLAEATTAGRPWADGGYIDRSERALVLPPWHDDGSEPDPSQLQIMERSCGPLQRGVEFVVSERRPHVVDFDAVAWRARTTTPTFKDNPWLLLDVDGVLLPAGSGTDALDPALARELDNLTKVYDLAWSTTWGHNANRLVGQSKGTPWPVVPGISNTGGDPDGYDGARVAAILDFVGDRPFAWVDDQINRHDAARLTATHDCLLLRPNPRRGLCGEQIHDLNAWAAQAPKRRPLA